MNPLPAPQPVAESTAPSLTAPRRLNRTNAIVLAVVHLLAVFAIVYLAAIHFSWWTVGLGVVWYCFCGLAITAGYHRLFSHKSYQGNAVLRSFMLLFGAASVQNSALKWSADHRRHHAATDGDDDPYNIKYGFWWAHVGWVLFGKPREHGEMVRDLESDPLVRLQHQYYVPLAILMSTVVPAAIGCAWGDPIGALLVAGFLRLALQLHATFSINSIAHLLGTQPYSTSHSGRDSALTALITFGEGYHNFHHSFGSDYRNGIRWYHFDPTKWLVWSASKVGMTWNLKRVADKNIERARHAVLAAEQPVA